VDSPDSPGFRVIAGHYHPGNSVGKATLQNDVAGYYPFWQAGG